ncbi:MAG: isoamylase [Parachlamydiales bacterium]|jgi:isoamylase/glycogen operon protein
MDISTGVPYPFGTQLTKSGINFALTSKPATNVTLCLFEVNSFQQIATITLDPKVNKTGNIWHVEVGGIPLPVVYGWRINGPVGPGKRYRFDYSKVLLDPYAKAVYNRNAWGQSAEEPLLGVVTEAKPYDWEGDKPLNIPSEKLIIYEMYLRGFTQDTSSGVQEKGTYRGLIDKIPYLKDLGINAVEFLPIHVFDECLNPFCDPVTKKPLLNVWGYSSLNYFSPMQKFAFDQSPGGALNEFKDMVKALHKAGIEVILDVVYNHTGEGAYGDPPLTFKGIDYSAYYMLDANNEPLDYTGCGNSVSSNHPVTKEMIIESLRYWVREMHVDGFRFDLASVLYRGRYGAIMSNPPVIDGISEDPLLGQTKLIAEPWDAVGMYQVGEFYPKEPRWSEWNGRYRDCVRGFLNGFHTNKGEFATRISGSQDLYNHRKPYCSLNFVTCHDGFTLKDLVSYGQKHNLANGEDNRDGTNDNLSNNYGVEGPTENPEIAEIRLKQRKNFITILLLSQGIPMLYMGDEYGHTKKGNNNTYPQDNELNWFEWDVLEKEKGFYRFVKQMISFRKRHSRLQKEAFLTDKDISWHGIKPMYQAWDSPDPLIAFTLYNHLTQEHIYVAINMRTEKALITLPEPPEDFQWHLLVDTSLDSPQDIIEEDTSVPYEKLQYVIDAMTIIILKSKKAKTKAHA